MYIPDKTHRRFHASLLCSLVRVFRSASFSGPVGTGGGGENFIIYYALRTHTHTRTCTHTHTHTHTQDPQPAEAGGEDTTYDTLAKPTTEPPPAQEQEGVSVTPDLQ